MKKLFCTVIFVFILVFSCSCGNSSAPWPTDEFFSALPAASDTISYGKSLSCDAFEAYAISIEHMEKQAFLDYVAALDEAGVSGDATEHGDLFISYAGSYDGFTISASWQSPNYEYRSQDSDFDVTFSK